MTHKYYNLKELITEDLTRVEDEYLRETKSIHIDFVDPHNDETPYYQVTIVTFEGQWLVI